MAAPVRRKRARHQSSTQGAAPPITRSSQRTGTHEFFRYFLVVAVIQAVIILLTTFIEDDDDKRVLRGSLEETEGMRGPVLRDDDLHVLHYDRQDKSASTTSKNLPSDRSVPLDNYYSRRHIQKKVEKPVLIVGGSDGSGTRAVVDILGHLGVPMLVDDSGTYDVHAKTMFDGQGWPPLVKLILGMTRTVNYEVDDLPVDVRKRAVEELQTLQKHYQERASKLIGSTLQKHRNVTSKVGYGFKAPVTMLMLALLKQIYGSIKFLHVVRDGRDIAVSANQSPVKKFYDSFYADAKQRRQRYERDGEEDQYSVMAMQLWNDWNSQVFEWESSHNDGETFEYLVLRAEDLLDPDKKFESLLQLSDFVGSPKSEQELCCLSRYGLVDMGKSVAQILDELERRGLNVTSSIDLANLTQYEASLLDEASDQLLFTGDFESNIEDVHDSWNDRMSQLDKPYVDSAKRLEKIKDRHPDLYEKLKTDNELRDEQRKKRREERFHSIYRRVNKTDGLPVESNQRRRLQAHGGEDHADDSHRRLYEGGFGDEMVVATEDLLNTSSLRVSSHRQRNNSQGAANSTTQQESDLLLEDSPEARGIHRQVASNAIKQRYGKWVSRLEGHEELSRLLHAEGADALGAFGYEPPVRFRDVRPPDSAFQCDANIECEVIK